MTKGFVKAVEAHAEQNSIPVVKFEKNQGKDDVANTIRAQRQIRDGVVFIGIAQEKSLAFTFNIKRPTLNNTSKKIER
jgi:hypothetical protein